MAKKNDDEDVFADLPFVAKIIIGLVLIVVVLSRMKTWGIV